MSRSSLPAAELTVGQVASRSGVAVSALHFYEAEGLIHSTRTAGNQRRFPREVLRRVAFIRASQAVGIPLRRIRDALDRLPGRPHPDPPGLGAALRGVARRPRPADHRPAAPPGSPQRLHRLRMPLPRPVQAREP